MQSQRRPKEGIKSPWELELQVLVRYCVGAVNQDSLAYEKNTLRREQTNRQTPSFSTGVAKEEVRKKEFLNTKGF